MQRGLDGGGPDADGHAPARERTRDRLPRLTSIRAFAALFVLIDHLALKGVIGHDQFPNRIGFSAVGLFFILSGFVLAWSASGMAAAPFYRRRFARIYPTYLFMLVVALLVPVSTGQGPTSAKTIVATVFLVQSWALRNPDLAFGVNGVSWSLSCEAAFYLAFPLLIRLFLGLAPRWRWVLGVGWWALCSAVVLYGAHRGGTWYPLDYANPVIRSGEFVLGIVAAVEMRRGWRLKPWAGVVIAVASIVAVLGLPKTIPAPDVATAPLYLVIIMLSAHLDIAGHRGWLKVRPLVYAGEVSYAFYLVQEIIIVNLKPAIGTGVGPALVMAIVAAACAVVLHHAVERPAQRVILSGRLPWPLRPRRSATPRSP